MWPEEGNTKDVARRGNITGMIRKGEHKLIWPEVGNIIVVARGGEFNGCGQKRGIID